MQESMGCGDGGAMVVEMGLPGLTLSSGCGRESYLSSLADRISDVRRVRGIAGNSRQDTCVGQQIMGPMLNAIHHCLGMLLFKAQVSEVARMRSSP